MQILTIALIAVALATLLHKLVATPQVAKMKFAFPMPYSRYTMRKMYWLRFVAK